MSRINIIVARARNGVIGNAGGMPWRLPEEMAHFKRTTMGHPIVMGRKTWESIVQTAGRPLPGRRNIVVTRNAHYAAEGAEVVDSLPSALGRCTDEPEVFVIGGAELYAQALPVARRLIITELDADFAGDTFFPTIDRNHWRETARVHHAPTDTRSFSFDIVTYERT
jgi:dihydrofolate reductase